jgi:hypothetical protein
MGITVGIRIAVTGSLCLFAAIVSVLSTWQGLGQFATADPEGGEFRNSIYTSPYFGLRYPLPEGWSPGPQPPPPSYTGYYVLATPLAPEHVKATMLIAAQDVFFADEVSGDATSFVQDLAQNLLGRGHGDVPTPATIAGHPFQRLSIPGTPLSRIVLATEIRCHIVIFSFTGAELARLETLAASLKRLSFEEGSAAPACIKGYATAQTVRRRVNPLPSGPRFVTIPVRISIGASGIARHVHVIRASPEQRRSIENALTKWHFVPYTVNGQPFEVETGLNFAFRPAGDANTLHGGGAP